jgi:hypothetical protein
MARPAPGARLIDCIETITMCVPISLAALHARYCWLLGEPNFMTPWCPWVNPSVYGCIKRVPEVLAASSEFELITEVI